jgi:hypothetical protein
MVERECVMCRKWRKGLGRGAIFGRMVWEYGERVHAACV